MANRAIVPSTFAILAGTQLKNELYGLGREFQKRYRRQISNYVFGPPRYTYKGRRMVDRSLSRLRSVRRATTRRRVNSAVRRYKTRRSGFKRKGRARRAMGTNGPAFRTKFRRTRYRAELGQRLGYHPSKRTSFNNSISTAKDKELHTLKLVRVPWSDSDEVMNRRSGRLVDVVGVKFRAWFNLKENLVESSGIWDNPIQIRWAIINPRDNTGADTDITNGTNFFVSNDPASDDTTDFPKTPTFGNCFKYMNRTINTRRYGVLQQGTFIISNDPAANNTRVNMRSKKFLTFYVPIKTQMKWPGTSTGGDYPNANVHFVYWYVAMGDKDTAQKFDTSQPFDFHYEKNIYFRNADILT